MVVYIETGDYGAEWCSVLDKKQWSQYGAMCTSICLFDKVSVNFTRVVNSPLFTQKNML